MMKYIGVLSALFVFASPGLAVEIEEIGTLQATFNGQRIVQPTVIGNGEGKSGATAVLIQLGDDPSLLSLGGFSPDNKRLGINVTYTVEDPDLLTTPMDLTITYVPTGSVEHWTSEAAPSPPEITFTTLEVGAEKGHATGWFTGLLCFTEGYESASDPDNCRPIEGSFETMFFVE